MSVPVSIIYDLINFNYYVTVNFIMCASIQACICVSVYVCACMYAFVTCVCMHLYIIIMCSAQPEVAAVLDWYGPEADPAYWQRGREEVAGLQVACKAHNVYVGGKFLRHPPDIFWGF